MHHNFAIVGNKVTRHTPKCSEIKRLHVKGQNLNIVIKCSLCASWRVTYSDNFNIGDIFNAVVANEQFVTSTYQ